MYNLFSVAIVKGRIRIGHSPDADDAFMFYAIASGKIDTRGLTISHVVEEIQSLNERAMRSELEVTAVSAYAYFQVIRNYSLLSCGASIGDNYGPIVVSKTLHYPKEIKGKRIAVPGRWTTAYLVLRLYEPDFEPVFVSFKDVIPVLKAGQADAALVIHEGQVTFKEEGFIKLIDLGEWYHEETRLPLPLGLDVVRTNLGPDLMRKIQRLLRESILYALEHRREALAYAMRYARNAPEDLIDRFVGMYVNDMTVDMGRRGKEGLLALYRSALSSGLVREDRPIAFVPA